MLVRATLSRRAALAAVVAGLALICAALGGWRTERVTPHAFGPSAPLAGLAGDAGVAPITGSPRADSATRPVRGAAPDALRVPALGVVAPVDAVASTDGTLEVPADVTHVGWWVGSAGPGAPAGSTVIAGHVDSAMQGRGALFRLSNLRARQLVVIRTRAGSDITYRVYARRVYSKSRALPPSLFAGTGPARLVLITCGGPFDLSTHSYRDNIVVFAAPVP